MLHDTSGQSPQSLMTDLGLKLFHGLFFWKSHSEEKVAIMMRLIVV